MNSGTQAVFHIGLLGGMFDPVHRGHLAIAQDALHRFSLDEMRFLPCGSPVHRPPTRASAEDRLAMLELAIRGLPRLKIDDRECRQRAPSYALHSLQAIKKENPAARLYLLLGMDSFNGLGTWHRWREIFPLTHLIIAERPGNRPALSEELAAECKRRQIQSWERMLAHPAGKMLFCRLSLQDVSSSQVRQRAQAGQGLAKLAPAAVADYIKQRRCYC